jgi:hypothetical protein
MNPESWQTGRELGSYVESMEFNQNAMRRRLVEVRLTNRDQQRLGRLEGPVHVLVMTEDWCSDSLMNLPIVARIVEATPGMDLRIFKRSEAAELNEFYIRQGITRIPVVTFLDGDFQEMGTWMERSQAAHSKIEEWAATHPEGLESPGNLELSVEERRQLLEGAYGDLAIVDELISLVTGSLIPSDDPS